jgi:glucokinase
VATIDLIVIKSIVKKMIKILTMDIFKDERVVLTLDAGGTNFVFGAMQGGKALLKSINFPSNADDLEKCLNTIIDGFKAVKEKLQTAPVAISFAFPGPADYKNGIIGDLPNLPAFSGGIALAAMLEEKFGIPIFIQNDGDLYAYGEAIGGILPEINAALEQSGSQKRYNNLVGLTLGTGFGAGIVQSGKLYSGDNSIPAEIWNTGNTISPWRNAEDGVSTRIIISDYFETAGLPVEKFMPEDIFKIAIGEKSGDENAAKMAFHNFGTHLGDAIANLIMLFDGIVVIGGGLTGAKALYMPALMSVLKGTFKNDQARLVHQVFNLDEEEESKLFYSTTAKVINVPFSSKTMVYDPLAKTAVATTKIGASQSISLGAYAFALSKLEE